MMFEKKVLLKEQTLAEMLDFSMQTYADEPFVGFVGKTALTYGEVGEKVATLQLILEELGIKAGDRVALLSENMPHWSVVYLAVTSMGAVIVPILPDFHENEVHHILRHSQAKAVFASSRQEDKITTENTPDLAYIFNTDELALVQSITSKFSDFKAKSDENFAQLKTRVMKLAGVKEDKKTNRPKEDDIAAILYTSGTTGQSKGVVLEHKSLVFEAVSAQTLIDLDPSDKFLSVLPLAHTLECSLGFLTPMLRGASVHYVEKVPTPRILVEAMGNVKPTYMLTVPLIIEKIYKNRIQPNFNKNIVIKTLYKIPFVRKKLNRIAGKKLYETFGGRLKFFGIGGSRLSPHVESFLQEAEFPYAIGYGLTETAPLLAGAIPGHTRVGSTGPAIDGVELKIVKQEGSTEDGEILARGPNVMRGYYKDEARTKEVLDDEGWFRTEDLGYFDSDGYLFISGRSKNVIIGAGGENIYPEQIESVINSHDLVSESLVYEHDGKVAALIYLDYEKIDAKYSVAKTADSKMHENIATLLETIRVESNTKVSAYSRVTSVMEQSEPFVMTPTKKIKRFLYTKKGLDK